MWDIVGITSHSVASEPAQVHSSREGGKKWKNSPEHHGTPRNQPALLLQRDPNDPNLACTMGKKGNSFYHSPKQPVQNPNT